MSTREDQLEKLRSAPGFIAALDQSGGSTPKALKLYGISEDAYSNEDEMFDLIHEMRTRIITSPSFDGDRILGAILFEMTMDREIEGMGSAEYCRDDPRIQNLAERQLAADRYLAVICACPIALVPRGLSTGRNLTCYPALQETMTQAGATWHDQAVVIDGKLITSQGPGTAMALALTLARILAGDDTAAEVASAMLITLPA